MCSRTTWRSARSRCTATRSRSRTTATAPGWVTTGGPSAAAACGSLGSAPTRARVPTCSPTAAGPAAPDAGRTPGGYRPGMRVTGDGGVGIEVFVDGPEDGRPVLLMHGWPDTHRLWRHQVAALTAAGYRTIAPDLRGFGDSD